MQLQFWFDLLQYHSITVENRQTGRYDTRLEVLGNMIILRHIYHPPCWLSMWKQVSGIKYWGNNGQWLKHSASHAAFLMVHGLYKQPMLPLPHRLIWYKRNWLFLNVVKIIFGKPQQFFLNLFRYNNSLHFFHSCSVRHVMTTPWYLHAV